MCMNLSIMIEILGSRFWKTSKRIRAVRKSEVKKGKRSLPSLNYRMQGGDLTEFGLFGCDPLKDRPDLIQRRETYFFSTHPSFEDIFSNAVSGDGTIIIL